jgi:Flp pilus assembly protein TadG
VIAVNVSSWGGRLRRAAREDGSAAVEFAIVLPLLLLVVLGVIQFGVTLTNYEQLTDGVRLAARQLAMGRSSTTPYTAVTTALQNGTPGLKWANIAYTVTVNGSTCNTDATCSAALGAAQGLTSSLTATYACNLKVMGINKTTSCTLSASTAELVE